MLQEHKFESKSEALLSFFLSSKILYFHFARQLYSGVFLASLGCVEEAWSWRTCNEIGDDEGRWDRVELCVGAWSVAGRE